MATIAEYKELIGAEFMASAAAKKLYKYPDGTKFSEYFPPVSVEGVMVYVFAFGMWVISTLYDKHRADVLADLAALKPHNLLWYVTKAKAYQHGQELPKDESGQPVSDVYATINEKQRIVKYAVAQEFNNTVLLKVAKYTNASNVTPQKLSDNELAGLKRYFSQIKDAGVPLAVISNDPDKMAVEVTIYYNPMLLFPDVDGKGNITALKNSDGVDVIKTAIQKVIENLPFNGDCKTSDILDAIKKIDGVDVADITAVQVLAGVASYKPVVGYCTPESGYFKLDRLTLTAKPYSYGNEI